MDLGRFPVANLLPDECNIVLGQSVSSRGAGGARFHAKLDFVWFGDTLGLLVMLR